MGMEAEEVDGLLMIRLVLFWFRYRSATSESSLSVSSK